MFGLEEGFDEEVRRIGYAFKEEVEIEIEETM